MKALQPMLILFAIFLVGDEWATAQQLAPLVDVSAAEIPPQEIPMSSASNSRFPKCETTYRDNCYGSHTFLNGNYYDGEWKNNMPDGLGKLRIFSKSGVGGIWLHVPATYIGEFKKGSLEGDGIWISDVTSSQAKRVWYRGVFRANELVATSEVDVIERYKNGTAQNSVTPQPVPNTPQSRLGNRIPMVKAGGTYAVPVLLNDILTLQFVVDSGASDVSIPADVVSTLVRTGAIREDDFIGNQRYSLADGSAVNSKTFRVRSIRIGGVVVKDVRGSVADVRGGLLLGQSFLERFKTWSMDNVKRELVLGDFN